MKRIVALALFCLLFAVMFVAATNRVLVLDGSGDSVNCGRGAVLKPVRFTMMSWFRCSASNDTLRFLFGTDNETGDGVGRNLAVYHANKLHVWDGTVGLSGTVSLVAGVWYHAAITYDGTNLSLYENGRLADSSVYVPKAGWYMVLGAQNTNAEASFAGQLDEMSVWDRALAANEIEAYRWGPLSGAESNVVGYWNFDNDNETLVRDLSPNGNDGVFLADAATAVDDGVVTNSIYVAIEIAFSGSPMVHYQLQYTTNLLSTNWVNTGGTVRGGGVENSLFDGPRSQSPRFYRIIYGH